MPLVSGKYKTFNFLFTKMIPGIIFLIFVFNGCRPGGKDGESKTIKETIEKFWEAMGNGDTQSAWMMLDKETQKHLLKLSFEIESKNGIRMQPYELINQFIYEKPKPINYIKIHKTTSDRIKKVNMGFKDGSSTSFIVVFEENSYKLHLNIQ